ncbi:uncharacterized protein [Drosophila suzukii]|uniref:DDE Tnp4 domain-containing protein n=1 Tax=Drosophila suzukii TaxID=28584 RepID=A0ABM4TYJ2_DROSZ
MLKNADDFQNVWNFPNCVGAIDGKHVPMKAPPQSGSVFFNYKGFHSIVILAVSHANYRFTYLDIGAYGSEGDMNAFSHCKLGKAIFLDQLNFPDDKPRNEVMVPYYLVADDAFPLSKRISKPYSLRNLTKAEIVFNYRLSRARTVVESAFGILSHKWIAVHRTLMCHPDRAKNIFFTLCLLNSLNFVAEYRNIQNM